MVAEPRYETPRTNFNRHAALKLTESELQYLAGYWDAEGSFLIKVLNPKDKYPRFQPSAQTTNTDHELLEKIAKMTGGLVTIHSKNHHLGHKTSYCLRLANQDAIRVANQLLPYLRLKKKQATIIAEWIERRKMVVIPGIGTRSVVNLPACKIQCRQYLVLKKLNQIGRGQPIRHDIMRTIQRILAE